MAVLKYKKKDGSYATLTNISIKPIEPVQTTGSSTTDVMSQAAVTTELAQKLSVSNFNTYSGTVDASITGKASQGDLNTLSGTVTAHTADSGIHVTASDKTSWNDAAANSHTHANKSIIDGITGSVGTMAYENASSYSSATEISAALGNKVDKVEGKGLSTEDYTSAEKTKLGGIAEGAEVNVQADWSETATTSDSYILNKPTLGTAAAKGVSTGINNSDNLIESKHIYSGVGVTIAYDSNSKHIQLKNTSGSVLSSFDASSFIVDGMVDNVEVKNVAGSGTCLVVSFNTDSGKQNINIPISQIFDANNYYTTGQTSGSTQIQTALDGKSDTGHTHDDRYYTESELTGSSTTVVVAKANSASTAANASTVNGHTVNTDVPADAVFTDNNTTYAAGDFITITGTNNSINVTTGATSSTVARGDHNHSGVYQPVGSYLTAITSSDVTTALGFTPMSNAMLQYSAVTVTANLNSQVCPVTLTTNGQQCNVLYVNNATAHTVSISTNSGYVTPDGKALTLDIKANGYGEVNYLYYDGTIYARGV